ncbi:hypothetical protein ACFYNO_22345 [Kitasatospora sp. NPDC006697]|uniref:hypothetical protein n=1 Tax=Kitasatospora sp. NPDC006697 TaxID=3364020 RepID=UPI00368CC677
MDGLSCGQGRLAAHRIMDVQVGGETRTFYWSPVPFDRGGRYAAEVRRAGQPDHDTVQIAADATVDC